MRRIEITVVNMGSNPCCSTGVNTVGKSYEDYAIRRRGLLGADARRASEVFSTAYAVGVALYDARISRGLTQRQLAATTGIDQADISRIERGAITPTLPTLLRLVEALGAGVAIVFDDMDSPAPKRPHSVNQRSRSR